MSKQNEKENLDLQFFDDEAVQIRSNEELDAIEKQLPKWNIEPPNKYKSGKKTDAQ